MAYPMTDADTQLENLDRFIAEQKAIQYPSRGAEGVPTNAPSPPGQIQSPPLGTTGTGDTGGAFSDPMTGLTYAQPNTPNRVVGDAFAEPKQPVSPEVKAIDDFIAVNQAEQDRVEQPAITNYAAGVNGKLIDVGHSLYWLASKMANPTQWANMIDQDKEFAARTEFKQWVKDKTGIATQAEPGSLAGKIGRNTADAIPSLAAFLAAAPVLAAQEGYGTMDFLRRSLGDAFLKHPWVAGIIPEVVGGVPGATIGEEIAGPAGGMAGGVAGNVATAPFQAAGRGAIKLSKGFMSKVADGLDALAEMAGAKLPGRSAAPPAVNDDLIDAYRNAEQKVRNAGDAVVQAGSDWRAIKDTGDLQTRYEAKHNLWAAKQAERTAAEEADAAWRAIPEAARGKYSREAMAIRSDKADLVGPQVFAEQQLAGDKKVVEDAITSAFRSARPSQDLTPEQYSERMAEGLIRAEKIATKVEQRYWNRVPLKEQMPEREAPLKDLDRFVQSVAANYDRDFIPVDGIKKLRQLFAAQSLPGVFQPLPTLQKVRGVITSLRYDRMEELAKDSPRWPLIANMTKLEVMANKWIGEAFPDNVPLQQARAWSNTYHDMFSKTEVFPLLQHGARGQEKVRPGDVLSKVMSRPHGLDDVYKVVDTLMTAKRIPHSGDAYPTALKPKQLDVVQQLADDTSNGIKAAFQDEVQKAGGDPTKLQGIMKTWTPRIQAFSKAAGEMQVAMEEALGRVADRKVIESSALQKYFGSGAEPEAAIRKLWATPNAPQLARALMSGEGGVVGGFSKDPIAMEGFRALLVDHLFTVGKESPGRIMDILAEGRINRLMRVSLGADRMDRLERLVSKAAEMERSPPGSAFKEGAVWLARLAAVKFSALVPNFGKGGELQQAAIFSQIAKRKVEKMLSGDKGPYSLLRDAVRDPSLEQLLFSKAQVDKRGMEINKMAVRRVLRFDAGLRAAYEGYMNSDQGPGPTEQVPSVDDIPTIGKQSANERQLAQQLAANDASVMPVEHGVNKSDREPIQDEMYGSANAASDIIPNENSYAAGWKSNPFTPPQRYGPGGNPLPRNRLYEDDLIFRQPTFRPRKKRPGPLDANMG